MGCPVGIGPELILKYFSSPTFQTGKVPVVVIGAPAVLHWCGRTLGIPASIVPWKPGEDVLPDVIPVYTPDSSPHLDPQTLRWGKSDTRTGKAMACWIEAAVAMALQGELSGIVTCPITKKALNEAGYHFPGHTEMLASLCRTDDYAMMMAGDKLKVTLVTIHMPLAMVSSALTIAKVVTLIDMTGRSLRDDFGIPSPRLAVAALNPHAGESGLFGEEEEGIIGPAIIQAREEGWLASGPYPPDTVFHRAAAGAFDAVVCMYHDQGLIPFKLLHFTDGVNVTIGIPIVRTSVDHGTAYDIAGKGEADPSSLIAAVAMAERIAVNRGK